MRVRSAIPAIASVLCVALGGLLLSGSTALASYDYSPTIVFGNDLNGPTAVAVDDATGEVYVSDTQNNRVEVFSAIGGYLGEFAGSEDPSKGLVMPTWIAIDNSSSKADPSAGDVYVADTGEDVVEKFKPLGGGKVAYVARFPAGTETPLSTEGGGEPYGVAVDNATGAAYVYTANTGNVFQFTNEEANKEVQVWRNPYPGIYPGLAVDDAGDLYLATSYGNWYERAGLVEKFAPEGPAGKVTYKDEGGISCECLTGVAVDEATKELAIDESGLKVSALGAVLGESFLSNGGGKGVAIDEANGNVYVVNSSTNQVAVFPAIELSSVPTATDIEAHSATVHGMVNGNGTEVDYQVEYGPSPSLGSTSPEIDAGGGENSVEAPLTDLTAGGSYYYRLVATTSQGTYYSETESFITAPEVSGTEHAFAITSFGATLSGTIDNPGNLDPNYHFVYGLTAGKYEHEAPVIEGLGAAENENQPVTWPIGGKVGSPDALLADTTYHFALVATNVGGAESIGPDETFTTLPYLPPIIENTSAQGVGETAATLTGEIDPQGLKTSYEMQYGTSASYGSKWPTVPANAGEENALGGVAIYVQNLQPGFLYHYRIVAINEDGTTYGPDETFTTQGYPIAIVPETPHLNTAIGILPPEGTVAGSKEGKGKGKGKGKKGHKGPKRKAKRKKGK